MRKWILLVLCLAMLAMPAQALSCITSAESETIVHSDGSCRVALTISLRLDAYAPGLVFPLPENARDITVNGVSAKSAHVGGVRNVELDDFVSSGGGTMTIRYTLDDAVDEDAKKNLILTVPLLSGFSLPIETLHFSITLPQSVQNKPVFTSTYFHEGAESVLDYEIQDTTISGTTKQRLQDRESLTMTLEVSKEMFPRSGVRRWSLDTLDLLMISVGFVAVLYWLAAMRCRIPRRFRSAAIPSGMNAGEIGCRLTGQGLDLTVTVLSWAQMGYVLIQMNDHGRVLLHKRMEMGNERTDAEVRLFRSLFKKRSVADATGYHYARLCRKALQMNPARSVTFLRASGNPRVFRVACALIGTLSGISLAFAFAVDTSWRVIVSMLLGIAGTLVAWLIQSGAKSLHNRHKMPMVLGILSGMAWLFVSVPAGEWNVALFVIAAQILAGLAAFYGGMRTESGHQTTGELLALRRYLRSATVEEIKRAVRNNPNYYYDLAPYALALDADRAFARQMGNLRLPECPYLTTGMDGHMTVKEWNQLMRETVAAMDTLQKRLPIDRLLGK